MMGVYCDEINIETNGETDIVDITSKVQKVITISKIKNGIVCIFVPGSTGSITTIEYEPGLMKDLPRALEK
ncbi:MAG: YjbQ family protein, partial [Candidatus Thermoplasmatota archaeon]|nr:YjbQ family protein [Candidatus Thermoplasmatota archaeon]